VLGVDACETRIVVRAGVLAALAFVAAFVRYRSREVG
jgi:hypothetical protein